MRTCFPLAVYLQYTTATKFSRISRTQCGHFGTYCSPLAYGIGGLFLRISSSQKSVFWPHSSFDPTQTASTQHLLLSFFCLCGLQHFALGPFVLHYTLSSMGMCKPMRNVVSFGTRTSQTWRTLLVRIALVLCRVPIFLQLSHVTVDSFRHGTLYDFR